MASHQTELELALGHLALGEVLPLSRVQMQTAAEGLAGCSLIPQELESMECVSDGLGHAFIIASADLRSGDSPKLLAADR